jgi:rRNA maturation protein Nop10
MIFAEHGITMELCPDCGSDLTRRIPRVWWMRLLFPNSVRILCDRCGERTLIRHPKPDSKSGTQY